MSSLQKGRWVFRSSKQIAPGLRVYNDSIDGTHVLNVYCPYCLRESEYNYSEVKPLAPTWESQKEVYESRISLLRAQKDKAVADAKRLAELAHQEYPTEDFEEPDQSSSSPNAPTPPEGPNPQRKKDDKPLYLQ